MKLILAAAQFRVEHVVNCRTPLNRRLQCVEKSVRFFKNTADIGTKPLSGKRIKLLLHWLGFQDENNEPVGSEELQEHRSQEQAKASVRMIKSKGNIAFAALLFSAISGISEGLFAGKVSGTVLQPEVGAVLWQDSMCSDMSACEQDRMCTDTTACALGLGTVCEACFQEPCVHPQMLSLFKDLGQVVQELCASHSPEGTEAGEASEEAAAMSAVVAKELKDLMEKQGLNIRMLAEQIKELKGTVTTMTAEIGNLKTEVQELQQRWSEFIEEEEAARIEYAKYWSKRSTNRNYVKTATGYSRRNTGWKAILDLPGARSTSSATGPTSTR